MKHIIQLEKRIKGKILGIKAKTVTPKESGIAILLNSLKNLDEVSYDKHIAEYKNVLTEIK